jgi:hypothetical protein
VLSRCRQSDWHCRSGREWAACQIASCLHDMAATCSEQDRTTPSNDFFERFLRTIYSNDLFERFIRTTPPNDNLTNLTAALDITQQASINFPFHTHPASIHKRRVTYPSCVPRTPYHSFKFPLISQREQTLPASNRQPSTNGTTAWGCCAPRSKLRNARE